MKKLTFYTGIVIGGIVFTAAGLLVQNNVSPSNMLVKASYSVYKHYNAIAATDNEHGCREFWVACSDYSYVFERPTEGTILEGGDITDNPSFDWDGMNVLDGRYIPSINEQKQWGMKPVLDAPNNKITYGLFPQTVIEDNDLIDTLNALPSSAIYEQTGYYYYNGNFYQTAIGDRCDGDSHFASGTKVVNGTKYWFLCEPISWVIMSNSGSTYLAYTEKAIHAGINWGYADTDTYETSQVRAWANGIDGTTYAGKGFYQTGLFGKSDYLEEMTITLDDGSATLNDYVRLLTKDEANDYFANDNARKVAPTDWTAAHHACFQSGSSSFTRWWLCEGSTADTSNAWGVGLGGAVGQGGPKTASGSNDRAERPVITITIS